MKRLKDVGSALANFFASGLLRLAEKLGPILWQLPPMLAFDAGLVRAFFELLPRTTHEAAELAAAHDPWLDGVYLKVRAPFDAANLQRMLHGAEPRSVPRILSTVTEEPRTSWDAWRKRSRA